MTPAAPVGDAGPAGIASLRRERHSDGLPLRAPCRKPAPAPRPRTETAMRILVVGAGGVGGYFGGRLIEAGADVTFLVRPRRAAQLAGSGLVVKSPHGDIRRKVAHVTADALTADYDIILLTTKEYQLAGAIDDIAPALARPGALVIPVLNGLSHLDRLDARFGRTKVMGGLARISGTVTSDGEVRQLTDVHAIVFGPRDEAQAAAAAEFGRIMAGARVDSALTADIEQAMWDKFLMLSTLAAGTTLFRATIGEISRTDEGAAILSELLDEAAAVAAHAGHAPAATYLAGTRRAMTDRTSPMTASMLRDLESGAEIEAEHIVGDMYRRGRAAGLAMPLFRVARTHLQAHVIRQEDASRGG